jgi:membrane-associated protein
MNFLDAHWIISTLGLVGILIIIFLETGLLIGLVFPGDSLLFLAGVGASSVAASVFDGVHLSLTGLLIGAPLAAIIGSQLGHWIGAKYGRRLFDRPDGKFFNHDRVVSTERWLAKYGQGKAIVLARFIPFVRTLINPMCGIIQIPAKKFFLWNVIGAIIWTDGIIVAGYFLGEKLEGSVDKYLLPVIALIIFLSLLPVMGEVIRGLKKRKA